MGDWATLTSFGVEVPGHVGVLVVVDTCCVAVFDVLAGFSRWVVIDRDCNAFRLAVAVGERGGLALVVVLRA